VSETTVEKWVIKIILCVQLMKATLLAENSMSFHQVLSAPVMSTDVSLLGVTLFSSFYHFLSTYQTWWRIILTTLSCHAAIFQSVSEVLLTYVAPLGAVSHRFILILYWLSLQLSKYELYVYISDCWITYLKSLLGQKVIFV
jgi:hypothetical protein